jgi:hydrogenase maturation protein HypF
VGNRASYEGQAAPEEGYPSELVDTPAGSSAGALPVVDTRPLIRADAARRTEAARIARRFHTAAVEIVAAVCDRLRAATRIGTVVLSGGVFLNALLTRGARAAGGHGVPGPSPPPGAAQRRGLSPGQLAVAATRRYGPEGNATPDRSTSSLGVIKGDSGDAR